MSYRALPFLLLCALFACDNSPTAPMPGIPGDTEDRTMVEFEYELSYCERDDTVRALRGTRDSYVDLIMAPIGDRRNGNFLLRAFWTSIMATGDSVWAFWGQQSGSYWGVDTTEVAFWPESGALSYGGWLMPLLIWHRVGNDLHGTYGRSCSDEGAWYYVNIRVVFENVPKATDAQTAKVCPEGRSCGANQSGTTGRDSISSETRLSAIRDSLRVEALQELERDVERILGPRPGS